MSGWPGVALLDVPSATHDSGSKTTQRIKSWRVTGRSNGSAHSLWTGGHRCQGDVRNGWCRIQWCAMSMRRQIQTSDRKSTRLNSSHDQISYAVFCLKKKKKKQVYKYTDE